MTEEKSNISFAILKNGGKQGSLRKDFGRDTLGTSYFPQKNVL
jgi:hypothetical protein